jgi:DNA-binding response OmpR family regulator
MKIIIVHNEAVVLNDLAEALCAEGARVTVFDDPFKGWDYLKGGSDDDLLITRIRFGSGNGVALARSAMMHRAIRSILFIGSSELMQEKRELGAFLPIGTPVLDIVRFLLDYMKPEEPETV